jgi:hypothetical protein
MGRDGHHPSLAKCVTIAAALEKVALVAVQDRINLLSPADGSNLSEVIR